MYDSLNNKRCYSSFPIMRSCFFLLCAVEVVSDAVA